jgi:hypothetical protein
MPVHSIHGTRLPRGHEDVIAHYVYQPHLQNSRSFSHRGALSRCEVRQRACLCWIAHVHFVWPFDIWLRRPSISIPDTSRNYQARRLACPTIQSDLVRQSERESCMVVLEDHSDSDQACSSCAQPLHRARTMCAVSTWLFSCADACARAKSILHAQWVRHHEGS